MKIMESADKFTDAYALTEEDADLYDAWVAVYNESVDAEGDEKSKKENEKVRYCRNFRREDPIIM